MKVNLKLHVLTSDPELRPYTRQIEKIAKVAIVKVNKLLKFKESVDIVLYRYNARASAITVRVLPALDEK